MHPVRFDLDYEVDRNRLTTFFRLLIAIPWIIVAYLYQVAAYVAALIAWVVMLFTKRYPEGLYNFVAGYLRFAARFAGFVFLATDALPPFSGASNPDYPVRVEVGPPQAGYSRAKTFFKLVLFFPQQVILQGLGFVLGGAAFISWWRIMFTGKQSVTMHDGLRLGLAYTIRSTAFLLLLTEAHPRLLDLPEQALPAGAPGMPPELPSGPAGATLPASGS